VLEAVMKNRELALILALSAAPAVQAETASDTATLTALLNDFLAGASRNDAAVHERFWSEDLIYTSSAGRRIGKADILRELRSPASPAPARETTTYTAEDVRIQQYGDTAVVAFRLVGTTKKEGTTSVTHYLNTGTFLKRDGLWRAVAWQATRMAPATGEAK
jgi:ketosteroid isomerase-like protein